MTELKPEAVAAVVSGKAMPADIFTGESLAKYFARKYLDMLAQRDMHKNAEISWEKAMMEAIGEDGTGSVAKAIAELKAQRDALAAEVHNCRGFVADHLGPEAKLQFSGLNTDFADSILNSVRAEGAEMFAHFWEINCGHEKTFIGSEAKAFAAQLRTGEPS